MVAVCWFCLLLGFYVFATLKDYNHTNNDQSGCLPFSKISESEDRGFKSGPHSFQILQSSQTNKVKIDTCRSLACRSTLLGYGNDWLAQCQDNATDWDSK